MKSLKDVTLYALTSIEIDAAIHAIMKSSEKLEFGAIKLLSDKEPDNLPDKIKWEYVPKMSNIDHFNYYMFLETGKHIETSHALHVHHHAWVINSEMWDDEWLQYDYIGAPWKVIENTYIGNDGTVARVGNDGFSLKSKKLLDIPKQNNFHLRSEQGYFNVDGQCCCYWRKEMLELGIKYASVEVAAKFSYENEVPENQNDLVPFGFHKNVRKVWIEKGLI